MNDNWEVEDWAAFALSVVALILAAIMIGVQIGMWLGYTIVQGG